MAPLRTYLIAGLATAILIGYIGPVQGYLDQREALAREQAVLKSLEERKKRLENEIAALDQPRVLEVRARELGLVRAGERAFIVRGLPEPPPNRRAPDDSGGGVISWFRDLV